MKRTLSIVLTVVMLFAMIPLSSLTAFATSNTIISVENVSAILDSTVDVSVSISGNPGIASMGFTLTFDEDLTLVGASNGEAFSEMTLTPPAQLKKVGYVNDSCRFAWLGNENVTENGTILNLKFKVAADAQLNKDCVISITCDHGDVLDDTRTPVDVEISNGKVTIIDYTPGDVDGDTNITMMDVLTLCQFYVDGCKYDPNGYGINIKAECGDVDANGKVNMIDVLMICQYYVDGCKYDPEGYAVKLLPGKAPCEHILENTEELAPTCTEDGNIAYWHCTKCGEYYRDANASNVISLESTVVKAKGHTVVVDPAVPETYESTGLTEGSHCSVCNEVLVTQAIIPKLKENTKSITYNIVNVAKHPYLATVQIDTSLLDSSYKPGETKVLKNLDVLGQYGYTFDGWFDGFGDNATQIKEIPATANENIVLYAHVTETVYDITYNTYQTPVTSTPSEEQLHYTVSKGNSNLYNPKINNYIFIGWYDNNGIEYKNIPVGTTGHIVLNAYYSSERNLAVAKEDNNPIILEDSKNGVVYFTYEIGEIRNIPLNADNPFWEIQSVAGLSQQVEKTYTTTITEEEAASVAQSISNATINSNTWTLSEDWNEVTSVNEAWAESIGKTSSQAKTDATTSSGTLSLTSQTGGSDYHKSENGATVYDYNSKTTTKDKGHQFNASLNGNVNYTNKMEANLGATTEYGTNKNTKSGLTSHSNKDTNSAGIKYENGVEANVDLGLSYGYHNNTTTVTKTGTDKVTTNSQIDENTGSWNNSATFSATNTHSSSTTVTNTLSDIITTTKEYGKTYSKGGTDSTTQGFASSESSTSGTTSTVTYSKLSSETVTTKYGVDGRIEGRYRCILVGTAHVFGVVGYDYNTKSYFTTVFSVMDDSVKEFLDYTPKGSNFDDCENNCLPFEIPFTVFEYVSGKTAKTKGVQYITDSNNGTARIVGYNGTSSDVIIPTYISDGQQFYKVTAITSSAFAGKTVRSVVLGDYIKSIPDGAFKNCAELEEVIGNFTEIGNEAFAGCINLTNMNIPSTVTKIGTNAFKNTNSIKARILNDVVAIELAKSQLPDNNQSEEEINVKARQITSDFIKSIINSGANNITIDISYIIDGTPLVLEVSEINSISIIGNDKKTYNGFSLKSMAKETSLSQMTVENNFGMPLNIGSEKLLLYKVYVSAKNVALLMRQDGATLSLTQDSSISSEGENAIISKNLIIDSNTTSDGAIGFVSVIGNLRYVNTITNADYASVTNGSVLEMTNEEFEKYLIGTYNVFFDVNEGNSLEETTKTVYFGSAYGELPTPTRDYYSFDGWYTATDNNERVTADTIYNLAVDTTLYAHWIHNPVSGWVKASERPVDSEVVEQKWDYTYTSNSTYSGSDTILDQSSAWSDYGSWSSWSKTAVSNSDSREVKTKTVTDKAAYTNYKYYIYRSSDGYGYGTYGYNSSHGACTKYDEINLTYPLELNNSSLGTYGPYNSSMFSHSYDCYWFSGGSSYIPAVTHTEYQYRDRHLVYTYNLESTSADPTGQSGVSNVTEYVQYRAK